jgi:hypothetical protein
MSEFDPMADFEPNQILRRETVDTPYGPYQIVSWREIDDDGHILRDFLTVLRPGMASIYSGMDIYSFIYALQNHPVEPNPVLNEDLKSLENYTFERLKEYLPHYYGNMEELRRLLAPALEPYRQAWPNFYT